MTDIYYSSTRGGERGATASQAILKGLAEDGGLFMPDKIPALDISPAKMVGMTYREIAYEVMKLYLTDFTEDELKSCIASAYDSKFDTEEIAPLARADGAYYLELFHGSTIAFKNKADHTIVILTATSGDTGKAAMAGFADVEGTRIIVFYPKNGVSRVQELQMLTQKGENTSVVGISGNFDDAQNGVKKIFGDREFAKELAERGYQLSSANSINIGRLVPQIVYYVYAYVKLLEHGEIGEGEKINITVPTGNFGNILAAYLAKRMGLPVGTLLCASNDNKVLYDFFCTGVYDRRREFILTSSPSMDILISSNLERLIYLSSGCDAAKTRELMASLAGEGSYSVSNEMREKMSDFRGGFATQEENAAEIRRLYDKTGYLIDTHTGVASCVYRKYAEETGDKTKTVIASTASPYKFLKSVMEAVSGTEKGAADEFSLIPEMERVSGVPVPAAIRDLEAAAIRHDRQCSPEKMKETVSDILK